jgi:hypothetical protein
MEAARNELEQGRPPTEKQEEALDRLDEALQKIDQDQKQDQEQLSREKREELLQQLRTIREKQKAAVDEASRIQDAVMKAKEWDRGLQASLIDLADDRQRPLAGELRQYAEKNLADLPVFQRLAFQSADAMDRAIRIITERFDDLRNNDSFDAETEKVSGERMLRPMQTALRRLDQILDSLKEDPKKDQGGGGGAGGDGGGGGDGGQQGPGIPPLAQLKALRAMQAEVTERTAAFAKAHPDLDKLTDDEKEELQELEQAQRDVADLFDKLAPLFRPQAPDLQ